MVFVPDEEDIPLMSPLVVLPELVVPLARFATVLLFMLIVPEPAVLIPITVWAFRELVEVALTLLLVELLPIVLLLKVVVPAVPFLLIP